MTRETRRRPGGRTARVREQILDATAELVARDGLSGFRYEEVAERAGVHKASVYRNWPDRDDLAVAALLRHAQELASVADTGDLQTDLVDFLTALSAGLQTPFGRTLERALQPAPDAAAIQTLTKVLDQRVAELRDRLDAAVQLGGRGEQAGHRDLLGPALLGVGDVHVVESLLRGLRFLECAANSAKLGECRRRCRQECNHEHRALHIGLPLRPSVPHRARTRPRCGRRLQKSPPPATCP